MGPVFKTVQTGSMNQDEVGSSSLIFFMEFSPIIPARLRFFRWSWSCAQYPWGKKWLLVSARQHGENVYICVITLGCSAGQGLTTYILSTPFKQGLLRTAASRQPHQTLEGFGNHWWQSNNKKKYGRSQSIFHLLTVGHLLHKRLVLRLTYLETEVAGSFAFLRGAQDDWKPSPKYLTCLSTLLGRKGPYWFTGEKMGAYFSSLLN